MFTRLTLPAAHLLFPFAYPLPRVSGWEYFAFIDEWSTEFNFDGLTVWDTQEAYHTYPGVAVGRRLQGVAIDGVTLGVSHLPRCGGWSALARVRCLRLGSWGQQAQAGPGARKAPPALAR